MFSSELVGNSNRRPQINWQTNGQTQLNTLSPASRYFVVDDIDFDFEMLHVDIVIQYFLLFPPLSLNFQDFIMIISLSRGNSCFIMVR